jgi:hypothetical protein
VRGNLSREFDASLDLRTQGHKMTLCSWRELNAVAYILKYNRILMQIFLQKYLSVIKVVHAHETAFPSILNNSCGRNFLSYTIEKLLNWTHFILGAHVDILIVEESALFLVIN